MEAIQGWIVSVTAMSLLVGLCRALMPEGSARRVGGMVCALLLFVTVVAPLGQVRLERLGESLSDWAEQYQGYSGALEETDRSLTQSLIEEQCAAYLEDRARSLGCSCKAAVTCQERDGLSVPASVAFSGALTQAQREQLQALTAAELGLKEVSFSGEVGT